MANPENYTNDTTNAQDQTEENRHNEDRTLNAMEALAVVALAPDPIKLRHHRHFGHHGRHGHNNISAKHHNGGKNEARTLRELKANHALHTTDKIAPQKARMASKNKYTSNNAGKRFNKQNLFDGGFKPGL